MRKKIKRSTKERERLSFNIIIYYLDPLFACIVKFGSVMLCLHYYSNYVTLRIAEDDGEEYSLDQIKEFDVEKENQSWSDVLARFGPTGRHFNFKFPLVSS